MPIITSPTNSTAMPVAAGAMPDPSAPLMMYKGPAPLQAGSAAAPPAYAPSAAGSAAAPAPASGGAPAAADTAARFAALVKQRELHPRIASQLREVLSTCDIVLLCDDSDSMQQAIAEEGTDPFAIKRSTRWLELKRLASVLIEIVTAINPGGMDVHFLNRASALGVTTPAGLSAVFGAPPTGGTPLVTRIRDILTNRQAHSPRVHSTLLLLVITDGEPTDGSRDDLRAVLSNKPSNVHISFAECTDQAEDMEFLDAWTGQISNFDNTDDYREELARVKQVQGQQFKFDYSDYVIKILLATFVRWYFNLDRSAVAAVAPIASSSSAMSAAPMPYAGPANGGGGGGVVLQQFQPPAASAASANGNYVSAYPPAGQPSYAQAYPPQQQQQPQQQAAGCCTIL